MPANFPENNLDLSGLELRTSPYVPNDSMMLMSGREVIGMVKMVEGGWKVVPFIEAQTADDLHAKTTCVVIPPLMMEAIRTGLKDAKGVYGTNDSTPSE